MVARIKNGSSQANSFDVATKNLVATSKTFNKLTLELTLALIESQYSQRELLMSYLFSIFLITTPIFASSKIIYDVDLYNQSRRCSIEMMKAIIKQYGGMRVGCKDIDIIHSPPLKAHRCQFLKRRSKIDLHMTQMLYRSGHENGAMIKYYDDDIFIELNARILKFDKTKPLPQYRYDLGKTEFTYNEFGDIEKSKTEILNLSLTRTPQESMVNLISMETGKPQSLTYNPKGFANCLLQL